MILKDTFGVSQSSRASRKFPSNDTYVDSISIPSRILPPTPPSQSTFYEPLQLPTPKITPQISTPVIEIPPPKSTQTLETSVTENFIVSTPILEQ